MKEEDKKKGIFGKAVDALTSRDEKEAAEAAAKRAKEAEMKAAEAEKKLAEAEKKLEAVKDNVEREKRQKEIEAMRAERQSMREEMAAARKAAETKYIAEHKVGYDDTLSHLSLKYYGSAVRDFWWLIYEANKDVIGDDYNNIRAGMVLKIPELTAEQKADLKSRKQG